MGDTAGSDDDGTNQFLKMSKEELMDYLSARGLSTTGSKLALIGRAFVAWETGVPIKSSMDNFQKQLKTDYNSLLTKFNIPDPMKLPSSAWSEKLSKWPHVDMGKIFAYLLNSKDFNKDYIGKYKSQKAYSYFASKFVGTVLWAQVPNDPDKCFLSSEVTPSQSVRSETHKQWILLRNTGEIITSMCSCTAGMCETCNHVIAVLYKIEYAISNDLISESCTEKSCEWNKGTKKTIEPKRVEEMELRSDSALKYSSSEAASEARKRKINFDPRRDGENIKKASEIGLFFEGLSKVAPKCALFTGMAAQLQEKLTKQIPPTLQQAAEQCIAKNTNLDANSVSEKFGESLSFTKAQCQILEEKSRDQGLSSVWKEHRKGRITASNVKRVVRKIEELNRNKNAATTTLAHHLISGGQDLSYVPAIKWGREMEEKGLQEMMIIMKNSHNNVVVRRAGLYVKSTLPYIGASPDAILHCDCHGSFTVEIKCPYNLKGMDIEENFHKTDFLSKCENGTLQLKSDHDYYYQVQVQLAVTGMKSGYFCVSSLNGKPVVLNIMRDDKLWERIEQKIVIFFKSFISPYLLGLKEFFFCPSCDKLCLEPNECKQAGDNSVCCDSCNLWYHWTCQEYNTSNDKFICSFCREDSD